MSNNWQAGSLFPENSSASHSVHNTKEEEKNFISSQTEN